MQCPGFEFVGVKQAIVWTALLIEEQTARFGSICQ